MSRITKNQKEVAQKYDSSKLYTLAQACEVLKDITFTKFDATVELTANLGVDPRKANQMIRGVVTLPHGTGKTVRVLVLCTPDKENEAKALTPRFCLSFPNSRRSQAISSRSCFVRRQFTVRR